MSVDVPKLIAGQLSVLRTVPISEVLHCDILASCDRHGWSLSYVDDSVLSYTNKVVYFVEEVLLFTNAKRINSEEAVLCC